MKTIKEVFDFCNEFTFYDRYSIERFVELNPVRDGVNILLSESVLKQKYNRTKLMGNIEDTPPKVIDEEALNTEHKIENAKAAILQLLGIENLYGQKTTFEDLKVDAKDEKNLRVLNE